MDPKCASAECASLSGHRTPSASRSASAAAIIRRRARHFGPEGNYLSLFAPYLTDRHKSPGGAGVNYDSDGSDAVRAYATQAALLWVRDFRADALRLDAVHTIAGDSPRHIVGAICAAVAAYAKESGRRIHVVAESDLEDRKVVDPPPKGWGCSAMWADDFHHALHTLLTGEKGAFYVDFGGTRQLARASPRASSSRARWRRSARRRGAPTRRSSRPRASCSARRTTTRSGIAPPASASPRSCHSRRSSRSLRSSCSARGCRSSSWGGVWRERAIPLLHEPR